MFANKTLRAIETDDHNMRFQDVLTWFAANRRGLILGLVFGLIVAPFLAMLGMVIAFFEVVRSLLVGPMDLIGSIIPNLQTSPNSYYVPCSLRPR